MTPETPAAADPQPQGMSAAARVTGVLFEPAATFQDIARRPTFLLPMILVILASLVFSVLMGQRVGWDRVIQQRNEMMGQAMQQRMSQMPAEQREAQEKMQRMITPITTYAGSILGTPIIWLISAGLLMLIVKVMMSVPVTFKQVYSIVAFAAMPIVIQTILKIVVLYLKKPDDFNTMNPLAFNPGAFMDPATGSKFLYVVGVSLDVFIIWSLVLTAVGLKAAGGKRLSFTGALVAAFTPWVVFVLLGAGAAAAFS